MPTRPRIDIAGYHHIINRGVQIEWRFNGRGVSFEASSKIVILIPNLLATARVDESNSGVDCFAVHPVNRA